MTFIPQTAPITGLPPDPFKHVNYTLGMVLGADDFKQEFAYLNGHPQWLTRAVLGYGTICGLRVTVEAAGDAGPQVVVKEGTAISPRGQLIRVDETKCARLNDWLTANRDKVLENVGSPAGGDVRLYVVLCYRECETDLVPIPGEPCRTEDDSMAASRLKDYHLLDLRFLPPEQRQYDSIHDFVQWLREIPVSNVTDDALLRTEFEAAIRNAVPQLMSPPQDPPPPPDYILGSPPAGLVIPSSAVCDYLNLAFRLWVTELRPLWLGTGETPAGSPPNEECVLLGEVLFTITDDLQVVGDESDVTVEEERRPYLLPLQMLQEWALCGRGASGDAGASVEMRLDGTLIQWRQSDDDPTWTTLFDLNDLRGADGADVEMRLDGTLIQWRQSDDDPTWTTLFDLNDLRGTVGPSVSSFIIAAGRFDRDGNTLFEFNNMTAQRLNINPTLYYIQYDGFVNERLIIKGTVVMDNLETPPHVFEVMSEDAARVLLREQFGADAFERGFLIRVRGIDNEMTAAGFMIEVSQV